MSLEWGSYYSGFRFLKPARGSGHTNMEAELRDKNNCESIVVISAFFFFFAVWLHELINSCICLNYFELFFFYLHLVLTIYVNCPL